MKFKFISYVFLLLILICPFFSIPSTKATDSVTDQKCTNHPVGYWPATGYLIQSFKPSKNRLTKIDVDLTGAGLVNVEIRETSNYNLVASGSISAISPHGVYSVNFDSVTVVPGNSYYLYVMGGTSSAAWGYTSDASCYPNGVALVNTWPSETVKDFYFITYGYDYSPPTPSGNTQNNPANDQSSITNSSSNNKTLSNTNSQNTNSKANTLKSLFSPKNSNGSSEAPYFVFVVILGIPFLILVAFFIWMILKNRKKKK